MHLFHTCDVAILPSFQPARTPSLSQDKLPSPKGDIAITLLVPTNGAWLKLFWDSGLFIPSIGKLGDVLPATVLFNTMFGAISPEQVASFSKDNPGSSASIYGLLSGQNGYQINYWAAEKDQKTAYYFSSEDSLNDQEAETFRPVQVCNSWIYFTNKVLIPSGSGKIKDVEKITIPDNLPWESSNTEAPIEQIAPSPIEIPVVPSPDAVPVPVVELECQIPDPSLLNPSASNTTDIAPVADQESIPASCNTTFADEARNAGLGLLATALSQDSIKSNLPDPSEPNTLFAPVDSAFLSMLSDLGISITDALSLGDKLTGVILYHIHPSEALTPEQLSERATLSTTLGSRLNDDKYSITVTSDGASNVSLGSLKPGDSANIVNKIQVCGTTVFVIDKVLLPAAGVEDLPDPGVPVARKFQKSLGGGILDAGVARAIGPLQFCTVTLDAAGQTVSTETDADGIFYFEAIPQCAIDTGIVSITGNSQCVDGITKLPLAYDLYVELNVLQGNSSLPTRDAPLLVSPMSTILASPYIVFDSSNNTKMNDNIAPLLGFASAEEILFGSPSLESLESLVGQNMAGINSQALVTTVLGGQVISSFSNTSFEVGTVAIDNIIASQLDNMVDLGDPAEIQRILEEATTLATDQPIAMEPGTLQSVSSTIAKLNQVLKESIYSDSLDPAGKQENIKATVILAQNDIAPAIQSLSTGQLPLADFEATYGPEPIQQTILGERVLPTPQPPVETQEVVQQVASWADMPLAPLISLASIGFLHNYITLV